MTTPSARESADPARSAFPIAGIGVSAGSLDALTIFLDHLTADPGLAIVLVTHLNPHHKSLMSELLTKHTRMRVSEVTDGQQVRVDTLHVIPPDRDMVIVDGRLQLQAPTAARQPINTFLRSLAREAGEDAIAIILADTGSDGILGIKEIKGLGGMVIVQELAEAAHDGVPRTAIATGIVDLVLPIKAIPGKLIDYVRGARNPREQPPTPPLERILDLIHERLGFDFTHYKRNTLERRIHRRLLLHGLDAPQAYFERLRRDPEQKELQALVKDMLIGVTSFFRDPEVFDQLQNQVLPHLLQAKKPGEVIRVWVPGCSTGEEAFSLAILLRESLDRLQRVHEVQIFATDIDTKGIDTARAATYPSSIVADLSRERLRRWFRTKNDQYVVAKSIREMILFAPHDLLRDPPLLNQDLISCRNLLIYMTAEARKQLLPTFYQALQPGGYLLLGPSESVGQATDLFLPLNKKWKLFHRNTLESKPHRWIPPLSSRYPRENCLDCTPSPKPHSPAQLLDRHLLRRYGHPAVLIDGNMNVLYYFGDTSPFLTDPEGEPTANLIHKAREALRIRLRTAVHRAFKNNQSVTITNLRFAEQNAVYQVHVEPLVAPTTDEFAAVIFEPDQGEPSASAPPATDAEEDRLALHLEEELKIASEQLRGMVEELETANEELKSSNEELMSMNEELQSSNEEQERSKEELQALNEELTTVNAELNSKVEELRTANNDIENLLFSSNLPTLFVDKSLCIRRFTPPTQRVFHILPADIGRPLAHVAHRLQEVDLSADGSQVLKSLDNLERELAADDGRHYLMRASPYRTLDDVIDGVVLAFVDITERRRAHELLEERVAARTQEVYERECLLSATLEAYPDGWIQLLDADLKTLYIQGQGLSVLDLEPEQAIGQPLRAIYPQHALRSLKEGGERALNGTAMELEVKLNQRTLTLALSAMDPAGKSKGRVILVARDITERKRAEVALKHTTWRLSEAQRCAHVGDWEWNPDHNSIQWSDELYRIMGLEVGSPLPDYQGNLALYPAEDAARLDAAVQEALEQGRPYELRLRRVRPDGKEVLTLARGEVQTDADGKVIRLYGSALDITALTDAERQAREAHQHVLAVLESTTDAYFDVDQDFNLVYLNNKAMTLLGLTNRDDTLGRNLWDLFPRAVDTEFYHNYLRALRELEPIAFEAYFEPFNTWYEVHAYPSSTGLAVYFRIITERKRMEEALRISSDEARAASQIKSRFLANMSHELRTPLNGIIGLLDLLADSEQRDEQREYIEHAILASRRLTRLISDILDLSKVESGHLSLAKDPFEMELFLRSLEQLFSPVASRNQVTLTITLASNVPPRLLGDATRLHQILGNVVGNAIKFAQGGQVSLDVLSLGHGRGNEWVMLFIIKDNGLGMAEKQLESLFDAFVQAENRVTKSADGVGLGLSIVKNLVQRMDGSMCVGSEPGKGTEFVISLPFAEAPADTLAQTPSHLGEKTSMRLAGVRILGVDDDKTNRLILSRLLTKLGAEITLAQDGAAALRALQASDADFDLMLLDINMPAPDGLTTTAAIRGGEVGDRHRRIPIIALTAHAMRGDRERFLNAGMQAHVTKPIDLNELQQAIAEVLAKPRC
ncbi:Autoinducer 2 sensor kinase/phosphatase LuxQ [Thiorhodovibrio winogradskyi]|uniref:Autoinducer 2 sensor kinase/phosphatase LuxQ n=1 Tax=Thiorhodovibrio winogradskyi TaxID=77007 RepID=A0ABZ0S7V9_9GAMM|nr:CheR family methyltransferase [Thiorhodovibrio winogradskyi]